MREQKRRKLDICYYHHYCFFLPRITKSSDGFACFSLSGIRALSPSIFFSVCTILSLHSRLFDIDHNRTIGFKRYNIFTLAFEQASQAGDVNRKILGPQMITDYHMGDFDYSDADISGHKSSSTNGQDRGIG